ncbi:MAG: hypothetical protein NDJ89_16780 [Oligoflexia bacterium]|nr:hypothetical protein [Oligoflexia bacterium]
MNFILSIISFLLATNVFAATSTCDVTRAEAGEAPTCPDCYAATKDGVRVSEWTTELAEAVLARDKMVQSGECMRRELYKCNLRIPSGVYPDYLTGYFNVIHNGRTFFWYTDPFNYRLLTIFVSELKKYQICEPEADPCKLNIWEGKWPDEGSQKGKTYTAYQVLHSKGPLIHPSNTDLGYAQNALAELVNAGICR